jgi:hypothetical protein
MAGLLQQRLLVWLDAPGWLPAVASASLTTGLRIMTVWLDWKLPQSQAGPGPDLGEGLHGHGFVLAIAAWLAAVASSAPTWPSFR